jgi:hypothetical protein
MTPVEIVEAQRQWHAKSNQGCLFAAYLYNKTPPESNFNRICLDRSLSKDLIGDVAGAIAEHISNENSFILSIILPKLTTVEHLREFIELAKTNTNWTIDDSELWQKHRLVKVRVPLNEINEKSEAVFGWLLGFGPFVFYPKTRQSPYFEILTPTKSKAFLKQKFNKHSLTQHTEKTVDRGGTSADAHLADVYIKDLTDHDTRDQKNWTATSARKRKVLTQSDTIPFDDTNAKAKISFSYPISE